MKTITQTTEISTPIIIEKNLTTTEYYLTVTKKEYYEIDKLSGRLNERTIDTFDYIEGYFSCHDEVSYSYTKVFGYSGDDVSIIEMNFNKLLCGRISKIIISSDFRKSKISETDFYVAQFDDFLNIYHPIYQRYKLKEFSKLKELQKEPIIDSILLSIDILSHSGHGFGLIRFYDSYSYHIQESIGVYCKHFGIRIQNHFDDIFECKLFTDDDAKKSFRIETYVLTVYDSYKLGGIKTVIINKNFKQSILLQESNTIFINSFYDFLNLTGKLLEFLQYKIKINYI